MTYRVTIVPETVECFRMARAHRRSGYIAGVLAVLGCVATACAQIDADNIDRSAPTGAQLRQLLVLADEHKNITYTALKDSNEEFMGRAWTTSGRVLRFKKFGNKGARVAYVAVDDNKEQLLFVAAPDHSKLDEGKLIDLAGFVLVGGRNTTTGHPMMSAWFIRPAGEFLRLRSRASAPAADTRPAESRAAEK